MINDVKSAVTKEEFLAVIRDFRNILKASKEERKKMFNFTTFIFYSMIRGQDIKRTTHDKNSRAFLDRIEALASFSQNKQNGIDWDIKCEINCMKSCFPSLTDELIRNIICLYNK